jgi:hypothetical protein
MARPNIFVSYSHRDQRILRSLLPYLESLQQQNIAEIWSDTELKGGDCWREEIEAALNSATVAVLLISQAFLASRFIYEEELPRILRRQSGGKLTVLPVYLSPSTVTSASISFFDNKGIKRDVLLSDFQGFGTPDRTIKELVPTERDRRFLKLHDRIKDLAASAPPTGVLALPLSGSNRQEGSHAPIGGALVETQGVSPFQTAGMLPDGHPTYVPRECDHQLAKFLDDPKIVCIAINGDYEIGKSSLMMRVGRVLGPTWIVVGGGLGDLRSDRADRCVDNFFQLFAPHFGQLDSWRDLGRRLIEQPVLLLLDDLGEMLAPGAQAILPRVIDAALAASGKLRLVATLPVRIDQYLRDHGLANQKYHRPWRTLSVLPFKESQAKHLFSLLPAESHTLTEQLFAEVEQHSALKPRPLQCLADRLWHAHREREGETHLAAIIRDPDSYT